MKEEIILMVRQGICPVRFCKALYCKLRQGNNVQMESKSSSGLQGAFKLELLNLAVFANLKFICRFWIPSYLRGEVGRWRGLARNCLARRGKD